MLKLRLDFWPVRTKLELSRLTPHFFIANRHNTVYSGGNTCLERLCPWRNISRRSHHQYERYVDCSVIYTFSAFSKTKYGEFMRTPERSLLKGLQFLFEMSA